MWILKKIVSGGNYSPSVRKFVVSTAVVTSVLFGAGACASPVAAQATNPTPVVSSTPVVDTQETLTYQLAVDNAYARIDVLDQLKELPQDGILINDAPLSDYTYASTFILQVPKELKEEVESITYRGQTAFEAYEPVVEDQEISFELSAELSPFGARSVYLQLKKISETYGGMTIDGTSFEDYRVSNGFDGVTINVPFETASSVEQVMVGGKPVFSLQSVTDDAGVEIVVPPQNRYIEVGDQLEARVEGVDNVTWVVNGEIIEGSNTLTIPVEQGTSYNIGAAVFKDDGAIESVAVVGSFYVEAENPIHEQLINQSFLPWRLSPEIYASGCELKTAFTYQTFGDCSVTVHGADAQMVWEALLSGNYDGDAAPDFQDAVTTDGRVYRFDWWGVSSHLDRGGGDLREEQIKALAELGADATRFNTDNGDLYVADYAVLKEAGVQVIALYGAGSKSNVNSFERMLKYMKAGPIAIEFWNEPNLEFFWSVKDRSNPLSASTPDIYYKLMREAYGIQQEIDPTMLFIVASLAPVSPQHAIPGESLSDYAFYQRLAQLDAESDDPLFEKPNVVIGIHDYTDPRVEWGGLGAFQYRMNRIDALFPDNMKILTESLFPRAFGVTSEDRIRFFLETNRWLMNQSNFMGNLPHTLYVSAAHADGPYIVSGGQFDEATYVFVTRDFKKMPEFFALQSEFERLGVNPALH